MADTHTPTNPDAAPMHLEVKEDFSVAEMVFAVGLGVVAAVAGLVLGLILVND